MTAASIPFLGGVLPCPEKRQLVSVHNYDTIKEWFSSPKKPTVSFLTDPFDNIATWIQILKYSCRSVEPRAITSPFSGKDVLAIEYHRQTCSPCLQPMVFGVRGSAHRWLSMDEISPVGCTCHHIYFSTYGITDEYEPLVHSTLQRSSTRQRQHRHIRGWDGYDSAKGPHETKSFVPFTDSHPLRYGCQPSTSTKFHEHNLQLDDYLPNKPEDVGEFTNDAWWGKKRASAWKCMSGRNKDWRCTKFAKVSNTSEAFRRKSVSLAKEYISVPHQAVPSTLWKITDKHKRTKAFKPLAWTKLHVKPRRERSFDCDELDNGMSSQDELVSPIVPRCGEDNMLTQ